MLGQEIVEKQVHQKALAPDMLKKTAPAAELTSPGKDSELLGIYCSGVSTFTNLNHVLVQILSIYQRSCAWVTVAVGDQYFFD